jgi:hypothetical protein
MLEQIKALQQEYRADATPFHLWEAHIAARDYAGATAHLDAFEAGELPADSWRFLGVPDVHLARLITGWLQHGSDRMDHSAEARARLEAGLDKGSGGLTFNYSLAMALITATEGNKEETERQVRGWRREANQDLAELAMQRHFACRALGMAGSVPAALECLRSALAEPSLAMPFIEPILPYYDSIRDDPRFIEFLSEIRGG